MRNEKVMKIVLTHFNEVMPVEVNFWKMFLILNDNKWGKNFSSHFHLFSNFNIVLKLQIHNMYRFSWV